MSDTDSAIAECCNEAGASPAKRARGFEIALVIFWALAVVYTALDITHLDLTHLRAFIGGFDENSYFALTHSLLFDGDLNCANEFYFIRRTQPPFLYEAFRPFVEKNPDNPANLFPAGTAFAAMPMMAIARLWTFLAEAAAGRPYSSYSPTYVIAYCAANMTYGALALWLVFRMLLRWFDRRTAAIACSAAASCGSFLFYFIFDPGMSHLTSAFFGTAGVYTWLRWRDADRRIGWYAVGCGLCIGFAMAVRPYNAPLAFLLASQALDAIRNNVRRKHLMLAIIGAFIGFAPQLIAWRSMHGHWIANTDEHLFGIFPRHALQVLFSRRHGLFFWTPAMLVAFAGLVLGIRRYRVPSILFLCIFAGTLWMYGNWREWWLGVAFGMRGFDQVWMFAFGFAVAFQFARKRWPRSGTVAATAFVMLFALINLHLIVAFKSGAISHDGNLYWVDSISNGEMYRAQLSREWQTITFQGVHVPLLMEPVAGAE